MTEANSTRLLRCLNLLQFPPDHAAKLVLRKVNVTVVPTATMSAMMIAATMMMNMIRVGASASRCLASCLIFDRGSAA